MPYLKISLFFNLFLLIFQYSSGNIKRDQRLLVESKQNVFRLFGSNINYPLIKLVKMELKTLDLNLNSNLIEPYFTEIIIEIDEQMKNKYFYISIFPEPCNEEMGGYEYNTNSAIIGENGKKQMRILRAYTEYLKEGIIFCGLRDLRREVILFG